MGDYYVLMIADSWACAAVQYDFWVRSKKEFQNTVFTSGFMVDLVEVEVGSGL